MTSADERDDRAKPELEPLPEGTLIRPDHLRERRGKISRRWFVGSTVLAGLTGALAGGCRPEKAATGASSDAVPVVIGENGHGPHVWRPGTPLVQPPPDSGTAWNQLTPFRDPLPVPPRAQLVDDGDGRDRLVVRLRTGSEQLHADLPPTTFWGYEGAVVGPTIEVERGRQLSVEWRNELTGPIPLVAVELLDNTGDIAEFDLPGRRGAAPLPEVAVLPPWAVTHLHGLHTGGGNDGWPENAVLPGRSQLVRYENDQPAAALWYHDHAMHITRLTTQAGLAAGMYLIRDDEERAAGLPSGDREIPLVLCDRNLDVDSDGRLTGQLLYKIVVYPDQAERVARSFTGPFTLVNGKIWPYLEVEPARYRFRLLNAGSIRQWDLQLRVGDPDPDPEAEVYTDRAPLAPPGTLTLVGVDSGLLPEPAPIEETLPLSPSERLDVVIDFTAFAGQRLRFLDVGLVAPSIPQVMEFRVAAAAATDPGSAPPARLAPSFTPITGSSVAPLTERIVVITPAFPAMAQMWETVEVPAEEVPDRFPVDGIVQFEDATGTVRTLRRVSDRFTDAVSVMATTQSWERWTWLSLEGPGLPHPMHVHSFSFQVQSRTLYDVEGKWQALRRPDGGLGGGTISPVRPRETGVIVPGERGWKDTVRAGSGELVSVIGRYGPAAGRFVHHCHIYEHEDHRMMRPFSLLPATVARMSPFNH